MRSTATTVSATAVNTMRWLSSTPATIVVPVYQRQYRWDIGGCEQLLSDIRAVADSDDTQMHFLGSILSSTSADADGEHLVLIDGQQRITTLMLLVAALHHAVQRADPALAADLERVLIDEKHNGRTRLRPHRAWAEVFEDVILDRRSGRGRDSRFADNYAFFRSRISVDEVPRIWRGLQKLEHVAITLDDGANAQQIFESLNSTGEPLRDHELIHNYVLMGLGPARQRAVEDEFWMPIERSTGPAIGSFWRHFLVQLTGREIDVANGRGVYDAFRRAYPRLDPEALDAHAAVWRDHARIYGILLDPDREHDLGLARELRGVSTFGRVGFPLAMRLYAEHAAGTWDREDVVATLVALQSLYLRRQTIGLSTDRLVARLCRAVDDGPTALAHALARITPSDARVRVALKFGEVPHPFYVLGRLAGIDDVTEYDLERPLPLAPGDDWSGDGIRRWADYSEDEQNAHRALAPTIGNLTLLETALAERATSESFGPRRHQYRASGVRLTTPLAELSAWTTAAIAERTAALTAGFLTTWPRLEVGDIDDDGLTPILDAKHRRGFPPGWEREWDYVEYRGEHWEVKDIKYLFHRVFARLWADHADTVAAFSARRGGPIYAERAWNGQWERLDDGHDLYMGWDSRYMLTAVQEVLEEVGYAPEVFVKYSYIGDLM